MSAPGYETLPGERELWRGRQWVVTTHQIVAPDHQYWFEPRRLAEDLPSRSWVEHMADTKGWCDLEDFISAFCVACVLHGVRANKAALRATIERARERRREHEKFDGVVRRYHEIIGAGKYAFLSWGELSSLSIDLLDAPDSAYEQIARKHRPGYAKNAEQPGAADDDTAIEEEEG